MQHADGDINMVQCKDLGDEVVLSTSTAETMEDKQAKKEHVPAWLVRLRGTGADGDQADFCGGRKTE